MAGVTRFKYPLIILQTTYLPHHASADGSLSTLMLFSAILVFPLAANALHVLQRQWMSVSQHSSKLGGFYAIL